jgi:hypothetical protein
LVSVIFKTAGGPELWKLKFWTCRSAKRSRPILPIFFRVPMFLKHFRVLSWYSYARSPSSSRTRVDSPVGRFQKFRKRKEQVRHLGAWRYGRFVKVATSKKMQTSFLVIIKLVWICCTFHPLGDNPGCPKPHHSLETYFVHFSRIRVL